MMSQASRKEILSKINSKVGFVVDETHLSPATRQAISNLGIVQRHLFVIIEILRGEKSRVERSFILSTASRLGKDSGKTERQALLEQINDLQSEIDAKISDISQQIFKEESARQAGQQPPAYTGKLEMVQLKCLSCGAPLPIPTGSISTCQFCKVSVSIADINSQMKSMIQAI